MSIVCRPAQITDIPAISEVYWRSVTDISERHGYRAPPRSASGINPFYAFMLSEEPQGFYIAEDAGRIVGACFSWVRGTVWFLSHLFILPEYQGSGVGKTLLEKTLGYCRSSGAQHRGVITMGFNTVSLALYMNAGMYPRESIYLMKYDANRAVRSPNMGENTGVRWDQIDPGDDPVESVHRIDESVLGMRREQHHRFYLSDRRASCRLFSRNGNVIAYAYLWDDGRIGPLAAISESYVTDVLRETLGCERTQARTTYMLVPGSNSRALDLALSNGFTITQPYVLLSSRPFGKWDSYILHSPGQL